jgi:hypothetical protein
MEARLLALTAAVSVTAAISPAVAGAAVAPDVRNLEVTPKSFKAKADGSPVVTSGGGLVAFDLRDGARITFTFKSVKFGKREGGKCKPGKAKTAKKRCEIHKAVPGNLLYEAITGPNEFRFSGRVDNTTLKPGTYRLFAKAAGTAPRTSSTTFKIIK